MSRSADDDPDIPVGRDLVTVSAKDSEATVRLPPALQAELEESLEEADREEGISWDELSSRLQNYDQASLGTRGGNSGGAPNGGAGIQPGVSTPGGPVPSKPDKP